MTDNLNKSVIRILLLDDEPFMLKLFGRLLGNLGYSELSSHTSGHQALAAMADPSPAPDLILLDLNMPEMDGIEFVRHLVERCYAGSLVLISGEDERMLQSASTLVLAHKIPVLGHLKKPVSPEVLGALLAQWSPPAPLRARAARTAYDAEALRAAIGNGELVNYYQPKVAVADGAVVGVETLVAGATRPAAWSSPTSSSALPKPTA